MTALTAVDWALPAAPGLIADMRARLRAARLPASAVAGWEGGVNLEWLSGFAAYLADEYDWETDRNRFGGHHMMIPFDEAVGDGGLHVALPAGVPDGRMPILLLHGWPSSGLEYAQVAAQLEQAGLYPIVADLPGFGFSAPTAA
ncbi:MAG: epoxide hydrolase 1, partial [Sulfitobacter sp. SK025]